MGLETKDNYAREAWQRKGLEPLHKILLYDHLGIHMK